MFNRVLVRKHKIVAGWLATLFCVVCLHLYFNFNNTEKSQTSERLRKFKLKSGERLQAQERNNSRAVNRDQLPGEESSEIGNPDKNSITRNHESRDRDRAQLDSKDSPENGVLRTKGIQRSALSSRNSAGLHPAQDASNISRRDKILYKAPNENPKKRLPQAILIGTGKCGTRALLEYLGMHPNVVHATREVHFFDRDEHFDEGLDWYRAQMPASFSNQITLEKSPSYVEHERSAPEIYKMNKTVRLLWVVKDPVVRLMSAVALQQSPTPKHFYLERVNGSLSVKKYNNAVNRGKYIVHLKKWRKFFPLSQIHILDGGALKRQPVAQIQMVERFLDLPPLLGPHNFYYNATKGFYCLVPFSATSPSCLGKTKGRKHPQLNDTVKTLLYDFYRPYNEEFFKVIGKRFDWEPKDYT